MADYEVSVTIQGLRPGLLQHRFNEAAQAAVASGHRGANRKAGLSEREQAEAVCYREPVEEGATLPGRLYLPPEMLFACLREAGRFSKLGKRQVSTRSETILPAYVHIREVLDGSLLYLLGADGEPLRDFEVDGRRCVIPATGGSQMRYRPWLPDWRLAFTLEVRSEMPKELLRQIVDDGGTTCGLGDYRPGRGGMFGQYVVVEWSVADLKITGRVPPPPRLKGNGADLDAASSEPKRRVGRPRKSAEPLQV